MRNARTIFALFVLASGAAAADGDPDLRADAGSQVEQNLRADQDDLSRLADLRMVKRFAQADLLVPVPAATRAYYLHRIPPAYRYLRPWSKLFLDRLSSQFRARFAVRLRVTSLTRTVAYQDGLQRRNDNAAPAFGEKRSTHLTGSTLDISKKGMTGAQLSWMRRVLHSLHESGYIHAVEEFRQPAFHVMVLKDYPDYVRSLTRPAPPGS